MSTVQSTVQVRLQLSIMTSWCTKVSMTVAYQSVGRTAFYSALVSTAPETQVWQMPIKWACCLLMIRMVSLSRCNRSVTWHCLYMCYLLQREWQHYSVYVSVVAKFCFPRSCSVVGLAFWTLSWWWIIDRISISNDCIIVIRWVMFVDSCDLL